jgi:hypothetical protein
LAPPRSGANRLPWPFASHHDDAKKQLPLVQPAVLIVEYINKGFFFKSGY